MEKELRFKKEWFDVLNRCDRTLRADVMEAVFQYFFTGAEPEFADDARIIAFGFIRADIDAARRRRQQRLARKNNAQPRPEPQPEPQPECVPAPVSAPAPAPAPAAREPGGTVRLNDENDVYALLELWNKEMACTGSKRIPTSLPFDCELYMPVVNALRRIPYQQICAAIRRLRCNVAKPKFAQFFDSL